MTDRDNMQGLRDYAAMMIKTMTRALDVSPYAQGPDKAELRVRFWATLASMAQSRCGLAKAAVRWVSRNDRCRTMAGTP
jgi:hypothetical protein